ncbi:MAG: hypothetical protein U0229_02550 [Anaeromyxobacter sp.]
MAETATAPAADRAALEAEHAALAARLEARASILEVRRGSVALFVGLLGVGLTGKLSWDRWGIWKPGEPRPEKQVGPPLHIWLAAIVTIAVLLYAIRYYRRAKRLLEEEDALFARFREVRAALGYDA